MLIWIKKGIRKIMKIKNNIVKIYKLTLKITIS
jgi:hypothetical protein